MGVETNIKSHLPRHYLAAGSQRFAVAPSRGCASASILGRAADAAMHLFDADEIFKKTSYVAGLKRAGRDVAKDMREIGTIPLLMKTLLDLGTLDSDRIIVAGQMVAENLKAVKRNSHQDVAVSFLPEDGGIAGFDAGASRLNVKLTDKECAVRKTNKSKRKLRATNHSSGALWKDARQAGSRADGAAIDACGVHEKYCYADV